MNSANSLSAAPPEVELEGIQRGVKRAAFRQAMSRPKHGPGQQQRQQNSPASQVTRYPAILVEANRTER